MTDEMIEMIGKKVFIKTNSNRKYTGDVISVSNGLIKIIDKYNLKVYISFNEIDVMEEVR